MIVPDDKDWTWVLVRPCAECGFDASTLDPREVAGLIRSNACRWADLLDRGIIRAGRPSDDVWSTLEYACHVRDVFARFGVRMQLMIDEDDPLFDNWDQDASAIEDRYEEQDPAVVVADLVAGAEALATLLDGIGDDGWERPGRRSNGSRFTLDTISRYLVHDPIHHIWDVAPPA